jgi:RimJ/RimL family protein N-acetyltransferase
MRRIKQETDTKRLLLRKFHKEDVKEFYQIVRKHEVGKWLGLRKGMTFSESEDYLNKISDHWASHSFGVWAVTNKMNKDIIGHCGLRYKRHKGNRTDLSFRPRVLGARNCYRSGYCSNTVRFSLSQCEYPFRTCQDK